MKSSAIIAPVAILAAMFAAYKTGKLTLTGVLTGGVVAGCIYIGAGIPGLAMLAGFFVMATIATAWRKAEKTAAQEKRDAGQVLANGGVAAIIGLLIYYTPGRSDLFTVLIAAALASATADTLSSELGTVYGRRFFNIITFKPDTKGRDGVISIEGTLTGIAGSAVIALIYALGDGFNANFWFIIIAGTAGNIIDSVLGATLERRAILNNNLVNFANTAFAAWVAWFLF